MLIVVSEKQPGTLVVKKAKASDVVNYLQPVQPQQPTNHYLSSSASSSTASIAPTTILAVKKEKSVSDIMREAFQLLSYWPLDHHHGLVTSENEQQIHHSHVNMDEHLMF